MRAPGALLLALLVVGCGRIGEISDRNLATGAYLEFVNRVPSFWLDEIDGDIVIPFYIRDDRFPPDANHELLRETVIAAMATWLEPLEGRNVSLPVLWASHGLPPPERRVQVWYVTRGPTWLGVTDYDGDHVEVQVSVKGSNVERFHTRRQLLALTIHEFGHALGISQPGHSNDPNDIMFGHDLDQSWITLSDGDRATVRSLFPE